MRRRFVRQYFPLAHAVFLAALRDNKGRALLSVGGIALGVALGVAIDTINRSALAEFSRAARSLSGEPDVAIGGGDGFGEALYPLIARLPQVAAASPVVETEARLANGETLRIIGIDPFRAAAMQTVLAPLAEEDGGAADTKTARSSSADPRGPLDADSLYLSPGAARALRLDAGDRLRIQIGGEFVTLRIAGISAAVAGRAALMDIAGAQWRLQRLGRLSRIDVRLRQGVNADDFIAALQPRLPAGVHALRPQQIEARGAAASRAYRVNLDMLALVALFTGGFLVFSTQALMVVRRQTQFAVLRALGLSRRRLVSLLLAEGALIGALGALIGSALGLLLAAAALRLFGADLGGGYFADFASASQIEPRVIGLFASLGIAVAMLGSLVPALESAAARPAAALHASANDSLAKATPLALGLALLAFGAISALMPPVNGLPLFGYAAIGLILTGAIALMPRFSVRALALLRAPLRLEFGLALARLRDTPGQTATCLAAILVSFSLVVAMAIMVASFRDSLDDWLRHVLPADLYAHAGRGGDTAYFNGEQQTRIAALPGVARADFLQAHDIALSAAQPPVSLIARPITQDSAAALLPLQGTAITVRSADAPPVWISEAVHDLYGYAAGDAITLPIAGKARGFTVAGIWRDYVRQHGAIVLSREHYIELTGDGGANQVALWLAPGYTSARISAALAAALPDAAGLSISQPNEIRARSLRLFDRSFAITYALEAVAIVVGLFGVGNGFGAAIASRRREFGVLRHIGMRRGQILAMLGAEAALLTSIGAIAGLALGVLISLILIHVVNRQSFRWSMELHMPWALVAVLTTSLLIASVATALSTARQALRGDSIGAVREDW